MQAYAIKCVCCECKDSENPIWLGRAENPGHGVVSFPLLGLFQGVEESKRLCWRYKSIAMFIIDAIGVETYNSISNKSEYYYEIVPITVPDDKVIGRFQGY